MSTNLKIDWAHWEIIAITSTIFTTRISLYDKKKKGNKKAMTVIIMWVI
jgi:hypothetical protein